MKFTSNSYFLHVLFNGFFLWVLNTLAMCKQPLKSFIGLTVGCSAFSRTIPTWYSKKKLFIQMVQDAFLMFIFPFNLEVPLSVWSIMLKTVLWAHNYKQSHPIKSTGPFRCMKLKGIEGKQDKGCYKRVESEVLHKKKSSKNPERTLQHGSLNTSLWIEKNLRDFQFGNFPLFPNFSAFLRSCNTCFRIIR